MRLDKQNSIPMVALRQDGIPRVAAWRHVKPLGWLFCVQIELPMVDASVVLLGFGQLSIQH